MKSVGELGEDPLIDLLCQGLPGRADIMVGPGDDCAVLGSGEILTLLKTDAVVAGVHFLPEEDAKRVGWKAVARVLSDFAAMGGRPGEFLVTLALAPEVSVAWVEELYRGMRKCLREHGGVIVGGETTSLPSGCPTMISIAGRGEVGRDELVTRSGAQFGDGIYVTGRLGGSILGKHLDFTPRLAEAAWLVRHAEVTAMMDLSDGLAKDLPRLAKMSGVGFKLDHAAIPCCEGCDTAQALGDGEDYELLLTSPAIDLQAWRAHFPEVLTRIGEISDAASPVSDLSGGWDHFARPK